jgi:hypothetical protein
VSPLDLPLRCASCGKDVSGGKHGHDWHEFGLIVLCYECLKREVDWDRDRSMYGFSVQGPDGERVDPVDLKPAE